MDITKTNNSHSEKLFLFVTANKNETAALLDCGDGFFQFKSNQHSVLPYDANFYNIGRFGCYDAIHLELIDQASARQAASALSISNAIDAFHPDAVILVGVAFGSGDGKNDWQTIGDVLISKVVTDYESGIIRKGDFLSDGAISEAGKFLISTFNAFSRTWIFNLNKRPAKCFMGNILSGDKFIDDYDFKSQLFKRYPLAYGGEMEGRGAYAACRDRGLNEWIIVKGICDWGDGNTSHNKRENQNVAAEAAVSLLMHVFSDPNAFNKLPSNPNDYMNDCLNKSPNFSQETIASDVTMSNSEDSDKKEELHPIEENIEEADVCLGKGDTKSAKDILKSTLEQAEALDSDIEESRYLLAYAQMAYARILMLAHEEIKLAWDLADKAVRSPELKTKKRKYHCALLTKGFLAVFANKTDEANGVVLVAEKLDLCEEHKLSLRQIKALLVSNGGKQNDAASLFQENVNYCIERLAITEDEDEIRRLREFYSECLNQMSQIDTYNKKYVDASQKLRKACELIEEGSNSTSKAIYRLKYGESLLDNDQIVPSLIEFEKAEKLIDEYHVNFLKTKLLEARAQALYKDDKIPESKAVYEQALDLSQHEREKLHFHRVLAHFIVHDGDAQTMELHINAARQIAKSHDDALQIHGIEEQYENLRPYGRYSKKMLVDGRERYVFQLPEELYQR